MRVSQLKIKDEKLYVITHTNITERKLAEEKADELARIDSLTGIPNRRHYIEFLQNEWLRCIRTGSPISLATIDIDYFKLVNDNYGHSTGDGCIKLISSALNDYAKRPSDLCARTGGEEFSLVFSDTDSESALIIIHKTLNSIRALQIPNEKSPVLPFVTISVGLVTMSADTDHEKLINLSDKLLYQAKKQGRNQVVHFNLFKTDK